MDRLNRQVKEAMNNTMPKEAVFSEFEKQQVLNRIKNKSVTSHKKKRNIIPKTLTAAVLAGSVLLVGGIAGTQLGLIGGNAGEDTTRLERDLQSFYPNLSVGEMLNGWELVSKEPYEGKEPEKLGLLSAEFKGGAQITGTLKYHDETHEKYPGKLLFLPDQLSLNSLPVLDGYYPDLALSSEDQEYVRKIFGINGEVNIPNITLKVDSYKATFIKGQTIPDEVGVKEVMLPEEDNDIIATPFEILKDNNNKLILPEDLQNIYSQFAESKNDGVLAGLSPAKVFQLYFYAEEIEDYETQYALFIDDEQYIKVFPTYEDYLDAVMNPPVPVQGETLLDKVKRSQLEERIINEKEAGVSISSGEEGLGFGLSKNSRGIWRVNWMPIQ
ncbi:hypothetical protein ACFYKX_21185 [Cytobacillus sp. FJAT-54145]|uniref:DUF4179 domain-containing protein n=1 Tax=Cytobacillus spartinae TaxID=3299023 RepID=A0ABW6KJR4_9BACI